MSHSLPLCLFVFLSLFPFVHLSLQLYLSSLPKHVFIKMSLFVDQFIYYPTFFSIIFSTSNINFRDRSYECELVTVFQIPVCHLQS